MIQVECVSVGLLNRFIGARNAKGHTNGSEMEIKLKGLQPGSKYKCTVAASTVKGYGPEAELMVWTKPKIVFKPAVPELVETRSASNTVEIVIQPSVITMETDNR